MHPCRRSYSLSQPSIVVVPGNQCHGDKEDIFSSKSQEDNFAANKIQLTDRSGTRRSNNDTMHVYALYFEKY